MAQKDLGDHVVTYDDSPEAREKVMEMLLAYYFKHHAYSGESIFQMDAPQIAAPGLLADIAEKAFNFEPQWKDDE